MHFAQGILLLTLSKSFTLPVSGSYLAFNKATLSLIPASKVLFDISLPVLLAIFFFLSATAHLVIATIYNKTYNKDLEKGINKARWIEYSISASIMMIAISMLVGVYDLASLIMIF